MSALGGRSITVAARIDSPTKSSSSSGMACCSNRRLPLNDPYRTAVGRSTIAYLIARAFGLILAIEKIPGIITASQEASMADTSEQLLIQDGAYAVPRAFFAYPPQPYAQAETVKEAAAKINGTRVVSLRTWEDMSVAGKNVMAEICREINEAEIFCADITGLNPNVMFELGYAIARDKRI